MRREEIAPARITLVINCSTVPEKAEKTGVGFEPAPQPLTTWRSWSIRWASRWFSTSPAKLA